MSRFLSFALALLLATANLSASFASVEVKSQSVAADLALIEDAAVAEVQAVDEVIESDRRQLSWVLSFFTNRKSTVLFFFINKEFLSFFDHPILTSIVFPLKNLCNRT